jgi:hypothetical protein
MTDFLKILKYKISLKICPGGAKFFHTDRHEAKTLFNIL